jgi:histidine triad (HIT) family protein
MLSEEQVQKIKSHLLEQIENFPEEQRKLIKHKLISMNNEELEAFLEENNLKFSQENSTEQKCIFCSIVKKEIKSYILNENNDYIAILELNPLSKGHTLIIPKEHYKIEKIPESAIDFAKKVSSQISNSLNPKNIQFQKNEVLGHANLEIIPFYDEEKLEKHHATEEELIELFNLIKNTEKTKPKKEAKEENTDNLSSEKEPNVEKQKEEKPELPKIKPRLRWI